MKIGSNHSQNRPLIHKKDSNVWKALLVNHYKRDTLISALGDHFIAGTTKTQRDTRAQRLKDWNSKIQRIETIEEDNDI